MPPKRHKKGPNLGGFKQTIRRKLWRSQNSRDVDEVEMPPPPCPPQAGTSTPTPLPSPSSTSYTSTSISTLSPFTPSTSTQGGSVNTSSSNGSPKRKREEETERTSSKKQKSDSSSSDDSRSTGQNLPLVRRMFKAKFKIDSNAKTPFNTSSSGKEESADDLPKRRTGSDPGPIRKERFGSHKVLGPYQKKRLRPYSDPGTILMEISRSHSVLEMRQQRYRPPSKPGPGQREGYWVDNEPGPSEKDSDGSKQAVTAAEESKSPAQDLESSKNVWSGEVYPTDFTAFHEKYKTEHILCHGGYGTIFSGYRKSDHREVAIKRIQSNSIEWVIEDGRRIPKEVQMLIKVGAEFSNQVTPFLFDWYDIGHEVVVVLERPEPCEDLVDYVNNQDGFMREEDAKMIFGQLVDAALTMESKGVVHRDIKPDNVLITTHVYGPQARLIDFGCATEFTPGQIFEKSQGTDIYTSPEFYCSGRYEEGPLTAWQLGLTLYAMMNSKRPYGSTRTITHSRQPPIRSGLSLNCKNLIIKLMDKNPETRLALQDIQYHPWMRNWI